MQNGIICDLQWKFKVTTDWHVHFIWWDMGRMNEVCAHCCLEINLTRRLATLWTCQNDHFPSDIQENLTSKYLLLKRPHHFGVRCSFLWIAGWNSTQNPSTTIHPLPKAPSILPEPGPIAEGLWERVVCRICAPGGTCFQNIKLYILLGSRKTF